MCLLTYCFNILRLQTFSRSKNFRRRERIENLNSLQIATAYKNIESLHREAIEIKYKLL